MKYIITFLFSLSLCAQNFTEITYSEGVHQGILQFNDKESIYLTQRVRPTGKEIEKGTTIERTEVPIKNFENDKLVVEEDDTNNNVTRSYSMEIPLNYTPYVYFKVTDNSFSFSFKHGLNGKEFVINDTLPAINWQVFSQYKEILGYKCQKAVGTYKCRDYTVWFTEELKASVGPWHLNGLPGAILEAQGYKDFIATSVQQLDSEVMSKNLSNFQAISKEITYQEYKDQKEKMLHKASEKRAKRLEGEKSTMVVNGHEVQVTSSSFTISAHTYDLCWDQERGGTVVKRNF